MGVSARLWHSASSSGPHMHICQCPHPHALMANGISNMDRAARYFTRVGVPLALASCVSLCDPWYLLPPTTLD